MLAHEFAHVAAAAPWAESWKVVVGREAMDTRVRFRDDAPEWAMFIAYLAPAMSGLLGALVGGLALATGVVEAPQSTWELLLWSAMAMAWAIYTRPSQTDLAGAMAVLEGDDDG
jgi:hypothetical protein